MLAINIAGMAHGSVGDLLGRRQVVRSSRNDMHRQCQGDFVATCRSPYCHLMLARITTMKGGATSGIYGVPVDYLLYKRPFYFALFYTFVLRKKMCSLQYRFY